MARTLSTSARRALGLTKASAKYAAKRAEARMADEERRLDPEVCISEGVLPDLPGIYIWAITYPDGSTALYVGKYKRRRRPERESRTTSARTPRASRGRAARASRCTHVPRKRAPWKPVISRSGIDMGVAAAAQIGRPADVDARRRAGWARRPSGRDSKRTHVELVRLAVRLAGRFRFRNARSGKSGSGGGSFAERR